ncbi:MAG: hypothetical protein HKM04_12025 [Legionellales bacterium]|nr:hypothetical protein [Legionellales bacterium]
MSFVDNVKQLDTKQKGMLVATIGCLGLVIYLAYTTFFPGGGTPASSKPLSPAISSEPVVIESAPSGNSSPQMPASNGMTGAIPANSPVNAHPDNQNTANPPTPANLALLAQSQQMQQQYIQMVNEYQLAQLQQKLAAVDSQIAASKLTTTKSLVELKKLQPLLGSQYGSTQGVSNAGEPATSSTPQGFQTMYVGQVNGVWQAMLVSDGQYYQVGAGMRLPDGSVVSQITVRGVVITTASGTPMFLPMTKNLD